MANFLYLERRMISRERLRATSSAVKILALPEMRKLLETFRPTAAAADRRRVCQQRTYKLHYFITHAVIKKIRRVRLQTMRPSDLGLWT